LQNGILKKIAGAGPEKIAYFGTCKMPDSQYFAKALEPKGVVKEIAVENNMIDVNHTFLKRHMDYDKLYLIVHNNGASFEMSDIQIEWNGKRKKVRNNRISNAGGEEHLLKVTKFNDASIGKWNTPEGLKPQIPSDGCTPKGIRKIVELQEGESISQKIRIKTDKPISAKIKCWARYLPPIFDPSAEFHLHDDGGANAIFEDSYDFGAMQFTLEETTETGNRLYEFEALTPLHWVQIEKEVYITSPKNNTEYTFSIRAQDKSVQLAFVSVEI